MSTIRTQEGMRVSAFAGNEKDGRRGASMKPLFIPLKRQHFEAFRDGTKREEFRVYGPRWNEKTCTPGRPVVLSLGYGKAHRLTGVVSTFRRSVEPTRTPEWRDCYGDRGGEAACIGVELTA